METGPLGIEKAQGFELIALLHTAPVMFQPEKVQLGEGTAVTLTACPIVSEHPDGHEGSTIPFPILAVVRVAHVTCVQPMVTVRTGAVLTSPPETPVTVTEYCLPV
jgi:hypothetical protein